MLTVVICCDALHTGYLGAYGNEWIGTAALDRLAHDGFVFDACFPSHPVRGGWWGGLDAAGLLDRGVAIGHFSDWRRSSAPALPGVDAEFCPGELRDAVPPDRWPGVAELRDDPHYRLPAEEAFPGWTDHFRHHAACRQSDAELGTGIEQTLLAGLQWLARTDAEERLLWLDLDLTMPLWSPGPETVADATEDVGESFLFGVVPSLQGDVYDEHDAAAVRAGWSARVRLWDALLGMFLDELRAAGLYDEAVIAVTADGGMPLGEHEIYGPYGPWLYEERMQVPLVVRHPQGRTMARSPSLVTTADLSATLLDLHGIHRPRPRDVLDGVSLRPLLEGEFVPTHEYVLSGLDDQEYALRTSQWKLVLPVHTTGNLPLRPRELYAKPEDRWDADDMAEDHPQVADALELQLRREIDAAARGTVENVPRMRLPQSM